MIACGMRSENDLERRDLILLFFEPRHFLSKDVRFALTALTRYPFISRNEE